MEKSEQEIIPITPHTCPYATEICNDFTLCECDNEQTSQRAADI